MNGSVLASPVQPPRKCRNTEPTPRHLIFELDVACLVCSTLCRCPDNAPPSLVCDPGATARDGREGVMDSRITVCGQRLVKGASGAAARQPLVPIMIACGINNTVPGDYHIVFSIANGAGLSASVTRNVTITPSCPPGEKLCSDVSVLV